MEYHNKKNPKYLAGKVYKSNNFGSFVITKYINALNIKIRFLKTGYETTTSTKQIKNGVIKDRLLPHIFGKGFIGSGPFKSKKEGTDTKTYNVWRRMLSRCYNDKDKSFCYYGLKGVTVCDDWHNFQNFALWYEQNYYDKSKKLDLDKDIMAIGDIKIYSPETCLLVSHAENISGKKI